MLLDVNVLLPVMDQEEDTSFVDPSAAFDIINHSAFFHQSFCAFNVEDFLRALF